MAAKPTPKTSPKAIKATKAPKLSDIQASLKALETRMKRADTITRKQVKALEETVISLSDRTKKSSTVQKAALTRQVNKLSKKLQETTALARHTVEADLKAALERPDQSELSRVLEAANAKLEASEDQQAEAIRKVNLHLGDIARVVDARFAVERSQTDQRLALIETDTADAITDIGGKIETLSDEWQKRHKDGQRLTTEKVNELAVQTQADLERHKESMAERLYAEVSISGAGKAEVDAGFERLTFQIDRLNNRLDTLEHEFTALESDAQNPSSALAPPPYLTPEIAAIQPLPSAPPAYGTPAPMPLAMPVPVSNVVPMPDAYAPPAQLAQPSYPAMPQGQMAQVQMAPSPVAPSPITQEQPEQSQVAAAPRESHMPIEFVPQAYVAPAPAAPVTPPPALPYQAAAPNPGLPPVQSAPPVPNIAALDDSLPYADPAYAENGPGEMRAERIGQVDAKPGLKGRLLSKTRGMGSSTSLPISGRNLRVAGIAIGIGAIGLFAAKSILGSDGSIAAPDGPVMAQSLQEPAVEGLPINGQPIDMAELDQEISTIPTIGQYEDSQAPDVAPGKATTLADSAGQGNPVAEFQLGLSYLQDNRVDEAVDLIRLAANKNQPAAQYRLAKLYETGQGVTADPAMARKLTDQAARGGNRIAMHDLALYYTDGRGGVDKNIGEAVRWFTEAAQRGVVDSQFNLAVLAESGQASAPDINTAFFWYSIAAAQGDQFAQKRVSIIKDTLPETQLATLTTRIKVFQPKPINEAANGIFHDVPWAKPRADASAQVMQVRTVQNLLSDLGYNTGGADGAIGPRTREAIKSFEKANSLPETGRVDTDLIKRLELAAGV